MKKATHRPSKLLALLAVAAAIAAFPCLAFPATLVRDGKAVATIVTGEDPIELIRYAVQELNDHIERATGTKLPVLKASAVKRPSATLVLVGPSRFTQAMGIDPMKLPTEGYIVRATSNRLALIGRDEEHKYPNRTVSDPMFRQVKPGTLWAVYAFLEKIMGVKWLWPGDLGTCVPERDGIRIEDYYYSSSPRLVQRHVRSSILNRQVRPNFEKLGVDMKTMLRLQHEYKVWDRRHMMGVSAQVNAGHAYTRWYDSYYKDHPEWFAMYPDGGRYVPDHRLAERCKLCVSNPEVVDAMFRQGLKRLEGNPNLLSFSVCPNDSHGYCMCPACKAMDNTNAQPYTYWYKVADGRELSVSWVVLTDRYAKVWNELAKRLVQVYPDKFVFAYAYSTYRTAPVSTRLQPNVIIAYVGFSPLSKGSSGSAREQWKAWAATGCRLYLRPNFLNAGLGFPFIYARRMAEDIKFCAERGMMGTDFDTWRCHFATQGLNIYTLLRLLQDPSRSAEGIIDEYCEAGFGRAAPAVKAYFDRCERVSEKFRETGLPSSRSEKFAYYGKLFDRTFVQDGRVLLYRARVMEPDPMVQKRIDFLGTGLDYAELAGRALLKNYEMAVNGKDPSGALAAIAAREAFYRKHLDSWAVSVPTLRWNEWNPALTNYFGFDNYEALKDKNILMVLSDWKFKLDPEEVGDEEGWMKREYSDLDWVPIKAGKWWEKQGYGGGPNRDEFKGGYNGVAWYRKQITIPAEMKGRKLTLRFGGIDESGWVYVNGKKVAQILNSETPRSYVVPVLADITDAVHYGRPSLVAVKVEDHNGAGGLWRLVSIQWAP